MATTNLGKVSVTPKGEYDPLITYERLDVISHNGSSYIVKQASTGVTPIEGEFYALIAEKGDGGSFVKKAYKTYAAMDADKVNIPANSSVDVTNDPDESKNGAYIYDGMAFTRSQYDSKVVTDKIIADTAIAVQDAINNTVVSSGFVTIDSFELGATLTQRNQALRHAVDGKLYRWAGDLPKVVPASSTPANSGGIGVNAWLEVSDTVLRQDLANPDKGAALVSGASITVSTVDEIKALSLSSGVVVYLTQEGRAGEGIIKEGVHPSDPDSGIYIDLQNGNYWERVDKTYADLGMFGGLSATNDPMANLQIAVNHVDAGGTISTNGLTGEVIFDGSVVVDKPLTLVSDPSSLTLKLKDLSDLFLNNSGLVAIIHVTSNNVNVYGFKIDSNKLNQYTDNGGYLSFISPSQIAPIHVRGENQGDVFNIHIARNILINCPTYGINVDGGMLGSYADGSESGTYSGDIVPLDYVPESYSRNIIVEHNYIHGGCRAGIAFNRGVVNSFIRNNYSYNWGWDAFKFYSNCVDCHIENNVSVIDYDTLRLSEQQDSRDTNTVKSLTEVCASIGTSGNGPRTCTNCSMINNRMFKSGQQINDRLVNDVGSFSVKRGSKGIKVVGNEVYDSSDYSLINLTSQRSHIAFLIETVEDIEFRNNKMEYSGEVVGSGINGIRLDYYEPRDFNCDLNVIITGNTIKGYPSSLYIRHRTGDIASDNSSVSFNISGNSFINAAKYSLLWELVGANLSVKLTDNLFTNWGVALSLSYNAAIFLATNKVNLFNVSGNIVTINSIEAGATPVYFLRAVTTLVNSFVSTNNTLKSSVWVDDSTAYLDVDSSNILSNNNYFPPVE